MLSNEDLLNIIKEVCGFYKISYDDKKFVSQMREYLIDIISSDDSNNFSYDGVLDELDKYVFRIMNDEFVKSTLDDRRYCISNDPLYKLSIKKLVYMYFNDSEKKKRIADILIDKNMGLILRVANEYANSSVSVNDLIQAGCLGVLKALKLPSSHGKDFYQNIRRCIEFEISYYAAGDDYADLCDDDTFNRDTFELIINLRNDSLSFNNMDSIRNIIENLNINQRFVLLYMYGFYDGLYHTGLETAKALCTYRCDNKILSNTRIYEIKKQALLNVRRALELLKNQVHMGGFTSDEISGEVLINKVYKNWQKILKEKNNSSITEIIRRNELKSKLGRTLTLCEYFDCSYSQLIFVVTTCLSDSARDVLFNMYGADLRQPLDTAVNNHYKYSTKYRIYHQIADLIKKDNCKSDSAKKVYTNKI